MQLNTRLYYGDCYKLYDLNIVQPLLYPLLNPKELYYYQPKDLVSFTLNETFAFPVNRRLAAKINMFLGASFGPMKEEKIPYLFLNQNTI